jgi:Fe-S cluster assembly protein SufD
MKENNADSADEGILIVASERTSVAEPLRLAFSSEKTVKSHVVVVAENGSSITIFEELLSSETQESNRSHAVEIFVGEEASVEYVSLQTLSRSDKAHIIQRSRVEAGGSVAWRNATLGSAELTQDLRSLIAGRDARSSVDWMFYAREKEKYELTARNIFEGAGGGGEILMKGVVEEKAHVSCDGMIEIGPHGNGTDTYLTQSVLMLDASAKVDAIPGLEIKTNDVKASHSATVSRVTEEDLFYFAARGIPDREARQLYVSGFLSDLTQRVSNKHAKEALLTAIEHKYLLAEIRAHPREILQVD